jgi:hypothetical protein
MQCQNVVNTDIVSTKLPTEKLGVKAYSVLAFGKD